MKVLIKEKLSQHRYKDNHGYLICTDCIMARTGKQTYTRDECFNDGDYTEIEVDRKDEDVFNDKTLASFENVPITIEHPDCNVDPDNYNTLSVGHMRDIHKGMYQGKPVMLGTAVITDSDAIDKVESGELVNLSCGYDCDIADTENPKQTNIRGNHIALCQIPRAGITKIQDSLGRKRRHMRTRDEYKGYINGNIKDFDIERLVNSVKKRKENLHVTLDGNNGYVYTIFISGHFDSDAEKGEGMYVDIVQENKETSDQKRILMREFDSWKEFKNIYNNFKRRMKFTKDSFTRKHKRDAFVSRYLDKRLGTWQDVLRIYLEWNGILGYDSIIADYLENEDFDGLSEYLEDEGIYGYTNKIIEIYKDGEINIPDMDEEDYERFF